MYELPDTNFRAFGFKARTRRVEVNGFMRYQRTTLIFYLHPGFVTISVTKSDSWNVLSRRNTSTFVGLYPKIHPRSPTRTAFMFVLTSSLYCLRVSTAVIGQHTANVLSNILLTIMLLPKSQTKHGISQHFITF